jgi:hypothetical protein
MTAECIQHMIKKPDWRFDATFTAAINIADNLNVGFPGLAFY